MPRNIKKIAHDLIPLSDAATELSAIICELLFAIKPNIQFNHHKAAQYFDECSEASKKLAVSTKLIKTYLQGINQEADREGIVKN